MGNSTNTGPRGDVWEGDAGTSNTGTQGTRDVNNYCKSRKVSHFPREYIVLVKATHPALPRVPSCLFTKRRLGEDHLH